MNFTQNGILQGVRRQVLAAGLLVLPLLALAVPRAVSAEPGEWRECMDASLLDYNECLMEAGTWFSRSICDISWQIDVLKCTAEAVGEIRGALNPT
jgi:hypothetical protein